MLAVSSDHPTLTAGKRSRMLTAALIKHRAPGVTWATVADEMGLSPSTVRHYTKHPEWPTIHHEALKIAVQEIAEGILPVIRDAVGAVHRNLNCGHAQSEVGAAKLALNTLPKWIKLLGVDLDTMTSDEGTKVTIQLDAQEMTDEDVEKALEKHLIDVSPDD